MNRNLLVPPAFCRSIRPLSVHRCRERLDGAKKKKKKEKLTERFRSKSFAGSPFKLFCWRLTPLPGGDRFHQFSLVDVFRQCVCVTITHDNTDRVVPQPRGCPFPSLSFSLSSLADESISSRPEGKCAASSLAASFLSHRPRLPSDVDNLGKTSISVRFRAKALSFPLSRARR